MSKVKYEQRGKIGIITIDSPPVNSLDRAVFNRLEEVILQIEEDVAVVIIEGAGTKAFVAGADIKEFPGLTPEAGEALCLRGQSVFNRLAKLKQPVIAAIDGFTLGAGLELALACDIRIASARSQFGLPEVKLGIIPGYGGTQRLARLIGTGKAMRLIFSGEFISAEEAFHYGIIEEVTEIDAIGKAIELAEVIASRGPIAVQKAKEAITKGIGISLDEGLKLEAKLFSEICTTEDKEEGVSAFLEKREPVFKGN
ncbi:enoyl-CoA hydratase/isomerase family protein [Bacillus sp. FJAT-29790]|uniref:enoyl-CoA hydratase/isomerase family protein n=1 Tax=Bacillus sp. FJAT-29790 TaxID=1895002 RepID=UPI001C22A381|nr:enoyl-CoA hydratase-related protein [Bacillus sp. FJAT-29790]MBU8879779.1 enoyl-CoA hydratase/isomerase family protein [Bacillus sp. FJAT-29790]